MLPVIVVQALLEQAFAVQIAESALHGLIDVKGNAQFVTQEFGRGGDGQEGIALAATRTALHGYDLETASGDEIAQFPFGLRQRCGIGYYTDKNTRSDGRSTGPVKAADTPFDIFGPSSCGPDFFRLFFVRYLPLVAEGRQEDRRNEEMMLGTVHLDRVVFHERRRHGQWRRQLCPHAEPFDQVIGGAAVAGIADIMPVGAAHTGFMHGSAVKTGSGGEGFGINQFFTANNAA